ncbi:MAG: hypothetical protein WC821_02450 [archaeon]|jgi:hypothetical protein
MDCVLIGVSDKSLLWRFGKLKEKEYSFFVKDYAKFLALHFDNVIVTPDEGVYSEIALEFGKLKGKKPIAFYPDNDKIYGIKHIEKNFPKFDLRPIEGDWYKLNAELTKKALCVISIGFSPGVLIEEAYIKYHQSFGSKLNPKLKNIHLFIDERCIDARLPKSFEEQISNVFYFNSLLELEKLLTKRKKFISNF